MLKQDRTGLRAERSADEGSDYVPEGIEIPEERRQELLEEAKCHSARLIAKLGEPSAQAMARAERLWNEIHAPRPPRNSQ